MKRKIAQTFLIMMQQFKVQKEGRASRIESLSIAIALYLNYYKNFKFYLKEKVYYQKKKKITIATNFTVIFAPIN